MQTDELSGAATPAPPRNRTDHRFSYRGWDVTVHLDGWMQDGCVAGHADLRAGHYRCRLVLTDAHREASAAIRALAQGARALIADREALAACSKRDDER
jgi:hypothetical protein